MRGRRVTVLLAFCPCLVIRDVYDTQTGTCTSTQCLGLVAARRSQASHRREIV